MAAIWSQETFGHFEFVTDEIAVQRARRGDLRATEHLLNRYRGLVEKQARSYYVAGADHDDVVQEGMMGLWKAIRDFKSERLPKFQPFAELCVSRQIITAVKGATRCKHRPLNAYISLNKSLTEDEDASLMDVIPDCHCANPENAALAERLPTDWQDRAKHSLTCLEFAVLWYYLESWSYEEIARDLNCHTKCVDNALQRAKKKIKKIFEN